MAECQSTDTVPDEDEPARHRRERRELQANIQQLKKSINKNDKVRKKKVDGEIRDLEDAFAKRWANFDENAPPPTSSEPPMAAPSAEALPEDKQQSTTRKARRLANKEKREKDAHANDEPIDYDNQPEAIRRRDESSLIEQQLTKRGLELRSIASDGNCLFASIIDQSSDLSVWQLREIIADYLRQHRSQFEAFIETDYASYCDKLAKENVWGGQVELQACAMILRRPIEIIQGNGKEPIRIESPSSSDEPIVITYHRYLYSNGEHYNSTGILSENHDE